MDLLDKELIEKAYRYINKSLLKNEAKWNNINKKKSRYSIFVKRNLTIINKSKSNVGNGIKDSNSFNKSIYNSIITLFKDNLIYNNISYEEIIGSLNKTIESRDTVDVRVLVNYLIGTTFGIRLIDDGARKNSFLNLMTVLSYNLEHQYKKKGDIVFHEGDFGDKFFFILKGNVVILKSMPKIHYINSARYFELLAELQLKEYFQLMIKTIRANNHIFPIALIDLEKYDFEEILFRREVLISISRDFDTNLVQNIFKNYKRDPDDYCINFVEIENTLLLAKNNQEAIELYQKHFKRIFESDFDFTNYVYLENSDCSNLTIYEYEKVILLGERDYFGDYALNKLNNLRTASVECISDCTFVYINQEVYKRFIYEEMKKISEIEQNFFVDNFFISTLKKNILKEDYLHYFKPCYLAKKTFLLNEKNHIDSIYFIKEGVCEISITINLADLNKLINVLCSVSGIKSEMYQLKTFYQNIKNNLSKVQRHRIFILESKQELGLIEYFYQFPAICSIQVISEKALYYSLLSKDLDTILEKEVKCKDLLQHKAKIGLENLVNRLICIRNSLFSLVDENCIFENKTTQKNFKSKFDKEKKSKLVASEPKIVYQAHFEPFTYSKLNCGLSSGRMDNRGRVIEDKEKCNSLNHVPIKENLFKSMIVSKNFEENESYSTLNPEKIIKKKIVVSKHQIEKELNLWDDYYKKTKNLSVREDNIIVKNKNIIKNSALPYIFVSQQFLKKSKSLYKIKEMHKSIGFNSNHDISQEMNKSLKRNFSNSTMKVKDNDLVRINKKKSILNKELKKRISQVRSSYFSILSSDRSKK